MRRRELFLLLAVLAGCGGERPVDVKILPSTLEGGWRCDNARPVDLAAAPDTLKRLNVKGGVEGNYSGKSAVRVRLFEMPAQASAFEAQQKTRPEPGLFFFHKGRYFVMAEAEEPLDGVAFVKALESALP